MTDTPEKDIATATTTTTTTSLDDSHQQGVTIHIQLTEPVVISSPSSSSSSTQPPMAKATLVLYLYDKLLADAAATRLDSATCEINTTAQAAVNNGGKGTTTTVQLGHNNNWQRTATQIGKTYNEMAQPSLYVALDMSQTKGVTYATEGPVFGLSPGDTATFTLKPTRQTTMAATTS